MRGRGIVDGLSELVLSTDRDIGRCFGIGIGVAPAAVAITVESCERDVKEADFGMEVSGIERLCAPV